VAQQRNEASEPSNGAHVRLERTGCELRLVFILDTPSEAAALRQVLIGQLQAGAVHLNLGKPRHIASVPNRQAEDKGH
jgi:hypothetical protein